MSGILPDLALRDGTCGLEPGELFAWLEQLDPADLAEHARAYARKLEHRETIRSPKPSGNDYPETWARDAASDRQQAEALELLENPDMLKARVVRTLRTFWESHFKPLYTQHEAAIHQAIETFGADAAPQDLEALLERLFGRPIGGAREWSVEHERIVLVPLPFMGPYLISSVFDGPSSPVLVLGFDAAYALRTQGRAPDISRLKALADGTRLEILRFVRQSERFGGEIVTHLGISQPGVSRHLRLLVATGILRVRREGTSKFYAINDSALDAVAEGIRHMRSGAKRDVESEQA